MKNLRRTKKTSHKILATMGCIFALILIVPYFINWGSLKAPIVNAVKEMTGRDLTIDGAIRITLLPTPTLKVENIKLSNAEGASTSDMITLKSLDFHLSLLPLLKGQINVAKLELIEPVITLETFKDNRHNWDFTKKNKTSDVPKVGTTVSGSSPSSSSIMTGLALQYVQIKNGSVVVKNPTGTQKIEKINITGQTLSLAGPYTIQGNLQSGELILKTEASVGKFEDNLPINISLNISQNSKDLGVAQIDGTISLKEQTFSGKLNAPFAISTIIELPQKKIDLNKGLSCTSDIDVSVNAVNLTNVKIAAEDIKVVGTVNFLFLENKLSSNLRLKAAGADVDLSIQGLVEDGFNGKLQLVSENSEDLVRWFTTKNWSKIDFSSSVKASKDSVKLNNVSLKLGETNVKSDSFAYVAKQGTMFLSAKNFVYDNHKIDTADIQVVLKDGFIVLNPINIVLYSGKIDGEIFLETLSNKIKTDFVLSKIDLAQVLEKSSIHSLKKGELNGEIHLTAAGASSQDMISSVSGMTTVNVKNGTINNFNIKELIKRLKEFNNIANLPSLLDALNAKGETTFSTIKADFKLQNGQATTDNLTLISDDVEATGNAIINLVQWILSVNAKLQAKELSNFPALAFKAEGSLSDPKYGLDMKQMQELLVKKGVSSLIDQFIGKKKNKEEKSQDQKNSPQKNSASMDPEKIVKDIFKKLI